jgi:hypothetical protein
MPDIQYDKQLAMPVYLKTEKTSELTGNPEIYSNEFCCEKRFFQIRLQTSMLHRAGRYSVIMG